MSLHTYIHKFTPFSHGGASCLIQTVMPINYMSHTVLFYSYLMRHFGSLFQNLKKLKCITLSHIFRLVFKVDCFVLFSDITIQ